MLRQPDAQVFKKYSQMKLQMKREALEKLTAAPTRCLLKKQDRIGTVSVEGARYWRGFNTVEARNRGSEWKQSWKVL